MTIKTKRPVKVYNPITGELFMTIPENVPLMNGYEEHFHSWREFIDEYTKENSEIAYDPEYCKDAVNSAYDALAEFPDTVTDYEVMGISNLENFKLD